MTLLPATSFPSPKSQASLGLWPLSPWARLGSLSMALLGYYWPWNYTCMASVGL